MQTHERTFVSFVSVVVRNRTLGVVKNVGVSNAVGEEVVDISVLSADGTAVRQKAKSIQQCVI